MLTDIVNDFKDAVYKRLSRRNSVKMTHRLESRRRCQEARFHITLTTDADLELPEIQHALKHYLDTLKRRVITEEYCRRIGYRPAFPAIYAIERRSCGHGWRIHILVMDNPAFDSSHSWVIKNTMEFYAFRCLSLSDVRLFRGDDAVVVEECQGDYTKQFFSTVSDLLPKDDSNVVGIYH